MNLNRFNIFSNRIYNQIVLLLVLFSFSCTTNKTIDDNLSMNYKRVQPNESFTKLLSEVDVKTFFIGVGSAKNLDEKTALKTAKIIALGELTQKIKIEVKSIVKSFEESVKIGHKVFTKDEIDSIIATYSQSKLFNVKYKHIITKTDQEFRCDAIAYKRIDDYVNESKFDFFDNFEVNEIKRFFIEYIKERN